MARGGVSSLGGGGGGGYLPGADPRGYNPASGGIPGVTNPVGAITGNLGGLSGIIGSLTGAQSEALRAQYPGEYFSNLGQVLANNQRRAAGDISDLLPELQTNAAERAVAGGVSGSGAENTKLLHDLGLTRYGVESDALRNLATIQGEIPQVRPFDPSQVIGGLINAQERADLYRAAPVPEAAYQRALSNVGGGGGGGTPGYRVNAGAGGSVDDILKRYGGGGGFGPPVIASGTRPNERDYYGAAPYGSIDYSNSLSSADGTGGPLDISGDFGGSTGYQGGQEFGGGGYLGLPGSMFGNDIFGTSGANQDEYLGPYLGPESGSGGDQYSGGGSDSYYGEGEGY